MSRHQGICRAFVAALGVWASVSSASGAVIQEGLYRLHNHPDGSARPPTYGARLDELYDVTAGHDIFTFDFDHALSTMQLEYFGSTIRISGQAVGGRDIGGAHAADAYNGVYTFLFIYNLGVQMAPGDDDLLVDPPVNSFNYGTLLTPLGDIVSLRGGHYSGGQPDFRFGDTDNDLGHRGFAGLSGWGWLFHALPGQSYYPYVADSDWLFTAELVPAPGAGVIGLGALGMFMRRRR